MEGAPDMMPAVVSRQGAMRLLFRPFEAFFRVEALGGTVLIASAILALAWANSPFAASYQAVWTSEISIGARSFGLTKPLILWVNDFLMAIFFLLVGLEIKREVLVGELNSFRKALLPVVAAVGGMAAPALLFLAVARDATSSRGWGIPMATDIAFALGIMRLLGKRVPQGLVVFLTALAIIDDLGAILVLAVFYSEGLSGLALGVAAGCVLALVAMNRLGVRRPAAYVIAGIPLWVAILKSGAHATIAGVVVGLCIPATVGSTKREVLEDARQLLAYAEEDANREAALRSLEHRLDDVTSPLVKLEHAIHPWVAYAVVPVFALANAGISFTDVGFAHLARPTSLGVLFGLVVGKQAGVFGATFLAVRLGIAQLPNGRELAPAPRREPARRNRLHDVALHRWARLRRRNARRPRGEARDPHRVAGVRRRWARVARAPARRRGDSRRLDRLTRFVIERAGPQPRRSRTRCCRPDHGEAGGDVLLSPRLAVRHPPLAPRCLLGRHRRGRPPHTPVRIPLRLISSVTP